MGDIKLLDQITINQIAAGEVIDRPSSVVKELMENSIDAGATAITVEIKDGGVSLMRITDNGSGINKSDIPTAFLRHATSKITSAEDLIKVSSLGFRGEALSSITAVSMVELISKTPDSLSGARYIINGGKEEELSEVGVPEGTTFIVKNLFYNTPARRKFLKSASAEAGFISSIVEKIALSHPEISFKFINNGQNKLFTPGNGNLKDNIYNIFGRDIAANLLEVDATFNNISVSGYVGKPIISRGNRNYEIFFINGRYIKSNIVHKAIEDAYKPFTMNHNYPFTVLNITVDSEIFDVNVHPSKMEIRFRNTDEIYQVIYDAVYKVLTYKEMIPKVEFKVEPVRENIVEVTPKLSFPEPFEIKRTEMIKDQPVKPVYESIVQTTLFEQPFLRKESLPSHKLLGQVFDTYWLVEYKEELFIIDQHAAHEKVLYERMIKADKIHTSQGLNPPIIITLSMSEEEKLNKYIGSFTELGFEIEHFGGREYQIRAVPDNVFSVNTKDLFVDILDSMDTNIVTEKIAVLSCKAAVKGNHRFSMQEANSLIQELLKLENPYNCPHGRPTIISMSKTELEKKFKRIL